METGHAGVNVRREICFRTPPVEVRAHPACYQHHIIVIYERSAITIAGPLPPVRPLPRKYLCIAYGLSHPREFDHSII
jgi:hypothetical protein